MRNQKPISGKHPVGIRRILIRIGLNSAYGRNVVRGATRYARPGHAWLLHIHGIEVPLESLLRKLSPDGLITLATDLDEAVVSCRKSLRIVVVGSGRDIPGRPRVANDEDALAAMAAQHFLERGFRNFGFVDHVSAHGVEARGQTFRKALGTLGQSADSYHLYDRPAPDAVEADVGLRKWLRDMPKPLAIWAHDDSRGFEVLRACQAERLEVPDDVAVLGGSNDELLCEASLPPMSSIATPAERIGYEAARILDGLLSDRPPPASPVLLPPSRVVVRQSTDVLAIHDAHLAAALRFIREHASELISVTDVLRAVPVTRRRLEQLFQERLRRSPAAEIRHAHVERAKELLASTDARMEEIALRSGFSCGVRLAEVFRRQTGVTPSAFRRQFRLT